jgi:hypothetical protein
MQFVIAFSQNVGTRYGGIQGTSASRLFRQAIALSRRIQVSCEGSCEKCMGSG